MARRSAAGGAHVGQSPRARPARRQATGRAPMGMNHVRVGFFCALAAVALVMSHGMGARPRSDASPAARRLVGASETESITIALGSAVTGEVAPNQDIYYVLRDLGKSDFPVVVTLTPIAGDPDLAVSCDSKFRLARASDNDGARKEEVILRAGAYDVACDHGVGGDGTVDLFIHVVSWNVERSSYSLLAAPWARPVPTALAIGGDAGGAVSSGERAHYVLRGVQPADFPLAVSLESTSGDADLLVSCDDDGFWSREYWAAWEVSDNDVLSGERIVLHGGDVGAGCDREGAVDVFVDVLGAAHGETSYALGVAPWLAPTFAALEADVPIAGSVDAGGRAFFLLRNQLPFNFPITVTMTPDGGDANLRVACVVDMAGARSAFKTGADAASGSESVRVGGCGAHWRRTDIYIEVIGVSAADFIVEADNAGETLDTLQDEDPSAGAVSRSLAGGESVTYGIYEISLLNFPAVVSLVSAAPGVEVALACNQGEGVLVLSPADGEGASSSFSTDVTARQLPSDCALADVGFDMVLVSVTNTGAAAADIELQVALAGARGALPMSAYWAEYGATDEAGDAVEYIVTDVDVARMPLVVLVKASEGDHNVAVSCYADFRDAASSKNEGTALDMLWVAEGSNGCAAGNDMVFIRVTAVQPGPFVLAAHLSFGLPVDAVHRVGDTMSGSLAAAGDFMFFTLAVLPWEMPMLAITTESAGAVDVFVSCAAPWDGPAGPAPHLDAVLSVRVGEDGQHTSFVECFFTNGPEAVHVEVVASEPDAEFALTFQSTTKSIDDWDATVRIISPDAGVYSGTVWAGADAVHLWRDAAAGPLPATVTLTPIGANADLAVGCRATFADAILMSTLPGTAVDSVVIPADFFEQFTEGACADGDVFVIVRAYPGHSTSYTLEITTESAHGMSPVVIAAVAVSSLLLVLFVAFCISAHCRERAKAAANRITILRSPRRHGSDDEMQAISEALARVTPEPTTRHAVAVARAVPAPAHAAVAFEQKGAFPHAGAAQAPFTGKR
mmetsp:Transcript_4218/g.15546  ORF Transcript_4218/g.15546 Transcript_4218/m.15546 type:complete len:1018 (-) Transcript_4218:150-3203(-)